VVIIFHRFLKTCWRSNCLQLIFIVVVTGFIGIGCDSSEDGGGTANQIPAEATWVAGTWETTQEVTNRCFDPPEQRTDFETYEIAQDGNDITVTNQGNTYYGTVDGDQVSWSGSFQENGGTITINSLNLTLTGMGNTFNGTASWTWTDGDTTCSGTTQIAGDRTVRLPEPEPESLLSSGPVGSGDCEDVINAHGPGFLKVVNNTKDNILVKFPEYVIETEVSTNACEIYGLDIGYRQVEISRCADDNCDTWTSTQYPPVYIVGGETHVIIVTDSYFY